MGETHVPTVDRGPDGRTPAEGSLGRVTLVGGGPGDPALMTVAAVDALREADVVLYDRLAPHDELARLAPHAELVDVGKRPGHHTLTQDRIEALLVEHARAGRHVVRLKGGDPYVFGRGGEEAATCRAAGVPVRVVPGITSAVAAPAAAGIPVTFREVSRMFTVVSGHAPLSADELAHLAGLGRAGGTIVVLMGVLNLGQITQGLMAHGLPADTRVGIVERGCTPQQRTTLATLGTVLDVAAAAQVGSPAVIVVGAVVALADDGAR